MKEYKYKGYAFRMTNTVCGKNMRNLYEIDGLKDKGQRPFLTTIKQCKEYIQNHGKFV